MTIASFCHYLLLEQGPLSLEALADAASAVGVTTSSKPQLAVRQALRDRAAALPGERWAAAIRMLEGRVLTTRTFSSYDLGLLVPVCRQAPLPVAQGGEVHPDRYGEGLTFPVSVTDRRGLVALRVVDGVLHVEDIADGPALIARGDALAELLPEEAFWDDELQRMENARLWALLEQNPTLLTEPTAPLSECLPTFTAQLNRQEPSFDSQGLSGWSRCSTIALPASVLRDAEDAAGHAGLPVDAWIVQLLERELAPTSARPVPLRNNVIAFPSRLPSPTPRRLTP